MLRIVVHHKTNVSHNHMRQPVHTRAKPVVCCTLHAWWLHTSHCRAPTAIFLVGTFMPCTPSCMLCIFMPFRSRCIPCTNSHLLGLIVISQTLSSCSRKQIMVDPTPTPPPLHGLRLKRILEIYTIKFEGKQDLWITSESTLSVGTI